MTHGYNTRLPDYSYKLIQYLQLYSGLLEKAHFIPEQLKSSVQKQPKWQFYTSQNLKTIYFHAMLKWPLSSYNFVLPTVILVIQAECPLKHYQMTLLCLPQNLIPNLWEKPVCLTCHLFLQSMLTCGRQDGADQSMSQGRHSLIIMDCCSVWQVNVPLGCFNELASVI